MKKILAICIMLFGSYSNQAQSIIISGQFTNLRKGAVTVFTNYLRLKDEAKTLAQVISDDKGFFKASFESKNDLPVFVQVNGKNMDMYMHSGDSVFITADANNIYSTAKFSGKGVEANIFLNDYKKSFGDNADIVAKSNADAQKADLTEAKLSVMIDSITAKRKLFSKNYKGKKPDQGFIDYFNYEADYTAPVAKYFARMIKIMMSPAEQQATMKLRIEDAWVKTLTLENDKALVSPTYDKFITIYYAGKTEKESGINPMQANDPKVALNFYKSFYSIAKRDLTGNVRDYVCAKIIKTMQVMSIDGNTINETFIDYNAININKDFIEQLMVKEKTAAEKQAEQRKQQEEQLNAQKASLTGKPAPDFTFEDVAGKKYSLSDFKGKVVYLDAWASWCGPCKQQIPAAKELEEKMKGKDIVFLGVSIDRDEASWRKLLAEQHPAGIHILAKGDNGAFSQKYAIATIPRFIIIDKNGIIYDADAKRPSMGVEVDLEEALKK